MPTPHDMRSRLAELQQEYQRGEEQLRTVLRQEGELRETMMRISGAIQVLDELLEHEDGAPRETRTNAEPVERVKTAVP